MKIHFSELTKTTVDKAVIFLIGEDKKLSPEAKEIDKKAGGLLSKAIESSEFSGKSGKFLSVSLAQGARADFAILAGVGKAKNIEENSLEKLGGGLCAKLNSLRVKSATLAIEVDKIGNVSSDRAAALIANGMRLRSYNFDKYFTKKTADEKPTLNSFTVALKNHKEAKKKYGELEAVSDGVIFTRDLVSEPANVINPETLAEECATLEKLGIEVQILSEEEMYNLGMGALLGVGQGSAYESQLVIMKWNGLGKKSKEAPLAFVGKGVTFDTGGISIKPSGGMEEMKWDMGGAGVVIGLMKALAGRKAKVNAVGVVGLVENMPSGTAQRPGDVVQSYSGQTIEVLNTDAEGRLVLADALWYTQEQFKPKFIVDLATLTGAIIVALGTSRAGIFSNNDKLAENLFNTGKKIGEEVWRLPLAEVYDKQINSDIADMQNIGKDREAGSITAAQFLQRFVNNVPWAHIDIAGVAWSKKDSEIIPKGGTGYGVRLLNQLVADYYE
ncbi:MAG: leucyl aminopeptidase [Rickettsiales bacterium]